MQTKWTKADEQQLIILAQSGKSIRDIAAILNKSYDSVAPKLRRLKFRDAKILEYDPTNERILMLESKLRATADESNRQRQQLEVYQKKAALFESIATELKHSIRPFEPLPKALPRDLKKRTIIEDVVMHQSDEHMTDVVDPRSVQGFETYNFDVACARAETYVDKVLKITQQTLTGYRFPNLWLLRYGDHTSGEIHKAVDRSEFKNSFRNSLAVAQVHALMVRDLAPYFENVHVVCLPGNHGRRDQKKNYNEPWENWDYLINETASLLCKDIPNVHYLIPNAYSIVLDIQGKKFAVEHGDDIKAWNGIPYYGIERKTRRLVALNANIQRRIDCFVFGHFHQPSSLNQIGDTEVLINGAWKATDAYTFNSLALVTEPTQWLHGVHPEQGISWRFKVRLRSQDEKPKRYKVSLAQ